MATKHVDYTNAYASRNSAGLIKSASTSSCCANENTLLKTLQQYKFLRTKSAFGDEPSNLYVSHSYSNSEQNMPLLSDTGSSTVAVSSAKHFQPHCKLIRGYTGPKHFSDCDLKDIASVLRHISSTTSPKRSSSPEFSSHRTLDNVLINKSNNNGSIINFTAANDFNAHRTNNRKPDDQTMLKNSGTNSVRETFAVNYPIQLWEGPKTVSPRRESPARTNTTESKSENKENERVSEEKEEKRFRRSSSLKIHRESTSESPAQKKIVRFADAMGLDLTDVRTFLDELPSVPKSAYDDLNSADVAAGADFATKNFLQTPSNNVTRSLVPMFKQPGISMNFLDRVRDNFVCLENAIVTETPVCSITGNVRVRNIDFHKSVYVRYSSDNWRTFSEVPAVYVPDSCDGFSDKFSFIIYLYHVPSSQRIELAVRYHCKGSIFWDNNYGANYVFQSFASPPTVPSYFQCIPTANDRCNSFY